MRYVRQEAKANGVDDDKAMQYAAVVGSIELATEAISSGLGKVGGRAVGVGGVTDDLLEGFAKKVSSDKTIQNAILYIGGMVGEGFEEWLSEWGTYFANRIMVGYDKRTGREVWSDSTESFKQGLMMSAILNCTQLMQQGVPPEQAMRQGIDQAAAEAGVETAGTAPTAPATADTAPTAPAAETRAADTASTAEAAPTDTVDTRTTAVADSAYAELTPIAKTVLGQKPEFGTPAASVSAPADTVSPAARAMADVLVGGKPAVSSETTTGVPKTPDTAIPASTVPAAEPVVPAPAAETSTPTAPVSEVPTLPASAPPAMESTLPTPSPDAPMRLSESATTVRDADVTPEAVKQLINDSIEDGGYHYFPITNDATVDSAARRIASGGFVSALREWTANVHNGQTSAEVVAMGQLLYNLAVKSGDTKLALDILSDYQMLGTNTAQALQAMSLIKNQTPEGKLYLMNKDVQKLNEGMSESTKRRRAPKTRDADVQKAVSSAREAAVRKTAEKIGVDEKYNDLVFTFEYGQEATDSVERYVRNEAKRQMQPKAEPTAMESLVNSIKRFARQKFLKNTGKKSATSVELLTEYVQNQAFFDEVWHNAQQAFDNQNDTGTREYAGRFTKDGILDNSATNKFLQQAIYESAIASDETASMIAKQAQLMPAEKIAESIANDLIAKTGATGEIAGKIRNAAETYVNRVLEKNAGRATASGIVKGGMAEIGQTFREIASQPNATKEQIRQDLADQIAARYAVSPETAERVAETVMAEYDAQLREAMAAEVKRRFAPKDVKKTGEKPLIDKIIEAVNLGTFDTEYASAAAEKLFGNGDVRIDKELADAFINAKTDAERDAAVTAIQKDIARQLPSTFAERFRALRYLNMLGNFKTQGKNPISNLQLAMVYEAKNALRAGIEFAAEKISGGKYQRNTAFGVHEYMDAAKQYYETVKDFVDGNAKFGEEGSRDSFMRGVQDYRKIFRLKPMEAYRKATKWAVNEGDVIFIKPQFARYLSGYLKARGMDAETFGKIVNGEIQATEEQQNLIHDATEFAAKEAQEATLHDRNEISDAFAKMGRSMPPLIRAVLDGMMPFRRTPANSLVRSVEISPLGIVDTVSTAYQAARGLNGKTAADVINSFSKTATGTALFTLGAMMKKAGLARGREDDEKQDAFDKLRGLQDFSILFPDGSSYTFDWAAPTSVPFFMGVVFAEATEDGGLTAGEFLKMLGTVSDVLINTSMLQGVNDALENVKYSDNMAVDLFLNNLVNYVTQGIGNSLAGQVERVTEENRETTYASSDTKDGRVVDWTIGKAMNKLPGEYKQVEYVDAWGRTQSNGSVWERVVSNMFSPGYIGKNRSTEVDAELQRLYDAGQNNVFPSRISATQTVGIYSEKGKKLEDRRLTADEYVQYQKVMGQTSLELVKDLMKSPVYQGMSDASKAAAISDIYGYAKQMASMAVEETAKYGERTDISQLSNPAAYYAVKNSFSKATSDAEYRNYAEIDALTKSFSRLPRDVRNAASENVSGLEKVLDARENGYNAETYYKVYDMLKALPVPPGHSGVLQYQKVMAIGEMDADEKQKDYFMSTVLTGGTLDRYQAARDAGFNSYSASLSYEVYSNLTGTDANGDGKTDTGSKKAEYIQTMMEYGASRQTAEWLYKLWSSR